MHCCFRFALSLGTVALRATRHRVVRTFKSPLGVGPGGGGGDVRGGGRKGGSVFERRLYTTS